MSTTKIRFGYRDITFPGPHMGELRDSSHLLDNISAMRARIAEDGYLLLRGFIDRERVLHARRTILHYMDEQQVLMPDEPLLEGVMPKGGRGVRLTGKDGISHQSDILAVIEADRLFTFFARFFDEPATTFTYKWLRAVGNEQYTGAHCDIVYMGSGSQNLHTVWIPFGDIPVEQGTLAMCVGSHTDPRFERIRQTYGRMDVDRDRTEGWFSRDPLELADTHGGRWQTTNFRAGDVMIFGMYTMHASTTNLTNRFRLSCDVRYQPAGDPVDSRWGGQSLTGHTVHGQQPLRSMEDARMEWGV